MERTWPGFDLVNIGAASGPRRDSIASAYAHWSGKPPKLMTWDEAIEHPETLFPRLGPDNYVRLDSPDQDERARAALYRLGEDKAEEVGLPVLSAQMVSQLRAGDIGSPAQLAFGLGVATQRIASVAARSGACMSVAADDLSIMFDKSACLARLGNAGLPIPRAYLLDGGFDTLVAVMEKYRMSRVFVKLRHGAAAAGMIALVRQKDKWAATTTAVIGEDGRPYATRAIRRLSDVADIARIVDCLSPLGLQVEQWLPKIGVEGRTVDLRLVVMGGRRVFSVLRSSTHPITNLHIGGSRGPVDALVQKIGAEAWAAVLSTAQKAAQQFPSAPCVGIDLAVLADMRRHAVLEVNAFGDHVRNFEDCGGGIHSVLMGHVAALMAARSPAKAA